MPETTSYLKIEIIHKNGVEVFDPVTIIMCLMKTPQSFELLEPTDQTSVISGEPALRYKTSSCDVPLTAQEIHSLVMKNLSKEQFFALKKVTGDFFEIHDDFYDPETGEALQPII